MASVKQPTRRTQKQRSETTVAALVSAARELFATEGYTATSLDAIVAAAGVTKGALYHHFDGKQAVFRAVYEHEQEQVVAQLQAAYLGKDDPWEAFEAACEAFLDTSVDPGIQRITLLDAVGALGWEVMREIESPTLRLTELAVRRAMDAERIPRRAPGPLAQLLFGAMCEGAMQIARAPDPKAARGAIWLELRRILQALAAAGD
jgi:AcrR family transcriptional regulator